MKFEEAMKLLKEGGKIYLCRPGCLVREVIYYIDRHQVIHKLTWDDDEQKWFDERQLTFMFDVDDLFSDKWEEYKWVKEDK